MAIAFDCCIQRFEPILIQSDDFINSYYKSNNIAIIGNIKKKKYIKISNKCCVEATIGN